MEQPDSQSCPAILVDPMGMPLPSSRLKGHSRLAISAALSRVEGRQVMTLGLAVRLTLHRYLPCACAAA